MANRNPPTFRALQQYDVNRAREPEALWQPLYDYGAPTADNYAAAGQTNTLFFQLPKGQSSKTDADTNMESAGVLPNPKQHLVTSIQYCFWPAASLVARASLAVADMDADFLRDVYTVSKSGFADFFVGSKSYLIDGPLGQFPNACGLSGWGCSSGNGAAAAPAGTEQAYARMAGPIYEITPVRLISQQNFSVTAKWPTAVALPSGVAARQGFRLGGFLYRLSQ